MAAWVKKYSTYYRFYCNTSGKPFGPKFKTYKAALVSNILADILEDADFRGYLDPRIRNLKVGKQRMKKFPVEDYDDLITNHYSSAYLNEEERVW